MPKAYRFDIDVIRDEIAEPKPLFPTPSHARWLDESWRDPEGFMAALVDYHARFSTPPAKSNLVSGFDFYCDAVLRHVSGPSGGERAALQSYDKDRGVRTWSYAELYERTEELAALLCERGVEPGAVLCCVLPFGDSLVLGLLSALRLGAVWSLVPPLGERYVARRLKALKPSLILTDRTYQRLANEATAGLQASVILVGEHSSRAPSETRSHTYGLAEKAWLLPSPLCDPPGTPVALPSADLYLRTLRDGVCIYGLRPGDKLFAPGFDLLSQKPALLLSALLCGATWVDMDLASLGRDPHILSKLGVTCLGINNATRDILRKAPAMSLPRLRSWFRPALEPLDMEAWRDLESKHGLGAVPHLSVHLDAAQGGAQLFSARRKGSISNFTLPAPGVPWQLAPIGLQGATAGQKAPGQQGIFLPLGAKKESAYLVLSRGSEGYFLGGTLTPRRASQVYPAAEVKEVVAELPWVVGAATLAVPEAAEVSRFLFVLLLFVGKNTPPPSALSDVEKHISFWLSAEHVPDCIELFPLYPRQEKGIVDEGWCKTQYLAGILHRKAQRRSISLLTALRNLCLKA